MLYSTRQFQSRAGISEAWVYSQDNGKYDLISTGFVTRSLTTKKGKLPYINVVSVVFKVREDPIKLL